MVLSSQPVQSLRISAWLEANPNLTEETLKQFMRGRFGAISVIGSGRFRRLVIHNSRVTGLQLRISLRDAIANGTFDEIVARGQAVGMQSVVRRAANQSVRNARGQRSSKTPPQPHTEAYTVAQPQIQPRPYTKDHKVANPQTQPPQTQPRPHTEDHKIANPQTQPHIETHNVAQPQTQPYTDDHKVGNPQTQPHIEAHIVAQPQTQTQSRPHTEDHKVPNPHTQRHIEAHTSLTRLVVPITIYGSVSIGAICIMRDGQLPPPPPFPPHPFTHP